MRYLGAYAYIVGAQAIFLKGAFARTAGHRQQGVDLQDGKEGGRPSAPLPEANVSAVSLPEGGRMSGGSRVALTTLTNSRPLAVSTTQRRTHRVREGEAEEVVARGLDRMSVSPPTEDN